MSRTVTFHAHAAHAAQRARHAAHAAERAAITPSRHCYASTSRCFHAIMVKNSTPLLAARKVRAIAPPKGRKEGKKRRGRREQNKKGKRQKTHKCVCVCVCGKGKCEMGTMSPTNVCVVCVWGGKGQGNQRGQMWGIKRQREGRRG